MADRDRAGKKGYGVHMPNAGDTPEASEHSPHGGDAINYLRPPPKKHPLSLADKLGVLVGVAVCLFLLAPNLQGCTEGRVGVNREAVVTTTQVPISEACLDSMRTAAEERDATRATPLINRTLSACRSADEWLRGLRRYPKVLDLSGPEYIDPELEFVAVCGWSGRWETPVCRDAVRAGYVSRG